MNKYVKVCILVATVVAISLIGSIWLIAALGASNPLLCWIGIGCSVVGSVCVAASYFLDP